MSAELRAQMDRLGPTATGHHWDAVESWQISWTWPASTIDGSCVLSSATVNYTNTVTSPILDAASGGQSVARCCMEQVHGRAKNPREGSRRLDRRGMPSVLAALHKATCTSANAAANAALDAIRKRQTDYDTATNHGATQGATFPLSASGGA